MRPFRRHVRLILIGFWPVLTGVHRSEGHHDTMHGDTCPLLLCWDVGPGHHHAWPAPLQVMWTAAHIWCQESSWPIAASRSSEECYWHAGSRLRSGPCLQGTYSSPLGPCCRCWADTDHHACIACPLVAPLSSWVPSTVLHSYCCTSQVVLLAR